MTWISVADRLPEFPPGRDWVEVLVSYRNGQNNKVTTANWVNPTHTKKPKPPRWEWWNRLWCLGEITHWMPLPEPPPVSPA